MSCGEAPVNIAGTKTSMKPLVKSSRKRKNRNNKKSKVAINSTLKNTTRTSGVDNENGSIQQTVKGRTENCIEIETSKKVSSIHVPITERECLDDFKDQRIINPNANNSSDEQETLPSRIDVNLRPCYVKIARFYNYKPSGKHSCIENRIANSLLLLYANNIQTEQCRVNNRNPHHDGLTSEREQKRNDNHQSMNSEQYNHSSKSYNSNNTAYRNNESFKNNKNGFQMNHIPEHEIINSNFKKRTVIHYSLAKSSIVELNTCENAWVPSRRDTQKLSENNEAQIEEIQKKVRSILNKITPETMVILTKSIVEMEITTYACLKKIIELLFQKAIDEPNFTPQYAYICSQMQHIEVVSEDEVTKTSFRQLIVLKCQETFELVSTTEKKAVKKLSEIKSCKDQTLKEELQSKYDEEEKMQRKRSVGNCRFMCEMFKVKLLNSNILQMCVRHLLKFPKEEPLECLCNILKHIGKHLNPEKTFEKLQEFTSKNYKTRISSRIRFMIQDTIDLKNNNWVPRNAVIKPKTLNEIEEEFTMVPTSNRVSSECTLSVDRQPKHYLYSNAQKVSIESFNIPMKSESCSNAPQDNIAQSNFEKKEVNNNLVTDNCEAKLNTCKNAWVPRFRIAPKSTATSEVKLEGKINEEKIIGSNPEMKDNIEPNSPTENCEIKPVNTYKNPWTPRWFGISPKSTRTNEVEMKEIKNVQEHTKPHTSITIKTDNKQNEINEEKTFRSNCVTKNIEPDSQTKFIKIEMKTSKNPWVPWWIRNSQKLTETNKIEIKEIETNEPELSKPVCTPKNIITDKKQDSCETVNSVVFSMTQENIASLTNDLILRISSVDLIEETIENIFKRAITEPSSIPLLVEICSLLKGIVLSIDKGATHVSFKKQLAARCQKLLQMGIPTMSKETYTMIGELFNKKLVPLNILVEFISDIPNQLTDASIENICYLLKIVGAEIERPYSLKPTMKILEAYVKNDTIGLVSSKHKDEIMDLLKLRSNKWIPIKSMDYFSTPEKTDQNVSRSDFENPSSIPEERKRGKNRRKKHAQCT